MVKRLLTAQGVTVVDLDGTLLTQNSLKLFFRNALIHALKHGRIDRIIAISGLLILRRLRVISHESMKYKVLAIAGDSAAMYESFGRKAKELLNPKVLKFLDERRREGDRIIVASAASESYIGMIWDGDFIASPVGGPDCRNYRKRSAVEKYIKGNGLHFTYFLTDHYDDLPTAEYAISQGANVILVNPGRKSLKQFRSRLPVNSFKEI